MILAYFRRGRHFRRIVDEHRVDVGLQDIVYRIEASFDLHILSVRYFISGTRMLYGTTQLPAVLIAGYVRHLAASRLAFTVVPMVNASGSPISQRFLLVRPCLRGRAVRGDTGGTVITTTLDLNPQGKRILAVGQIIVVAGVIVSLTALAFGQFGLMLAGLLLCVMGAVPLLSVITNAREAAVGYDVLERWKQATFGSADGTAAL